MGMTETYEKLFKRCLRSLYNDYIGWSENAYMDGNTYTAYTEQSLINTIYKEVITADYLNVEDSWEVMEAKHIRFLGKTKVLQMITEYVKMRHKKEGKWEWEK